MATYTANEAKASAIVPSHGFGGTLKVAFGSVELGTAIATSDTIEVCKVPKDAVIVGGFMIGDDLETGAGTLDLNVGWKANGVEAADPDGLLASSIITGDAVTGIKPEVGIYYPFFGTLATNGPIKFSAETTIHVTVVAGPTAGGTGTLTLVVHYVVDPNFAKTSV